MSINKNVVPEARKAFNQFREEIAQELGLSNYNKIDTGDLTYRQDEGDYVGGKQMANLIQATEDQVTKKQ
ncbi:alpha/beta-type small acid-soluble spore protein [Anaeromicrobium sediminis]|uniref:Small, acid-soluble spore protein, alpha/beta type n=1 Tax=Anaeromicrobium sediminis TaxID=1478221 RepID=A0A267ML08_9FIRM|nr:alpha/beta-type small acid-soluble spore protein [Anaeromicrobium sediminis]PAB60216.1 hypothetical protein CCE28_04770 [Anaeromicrobium sediminis]